MKDVSQHLASILESEALEIIQQLKSYPLFTGIRKGLNYDVKASTSRYHRFSSWLYPWEMHEQISKLIR